MQKLSAITKFLATIFLISMIWVSYSLISMVFQEHVNQNHEFIPEDANYVVRIDGRKLIKSSVSSVILNEDEEIIEILKELFEGEHETDYKGIGVELNSDIIIFNHTEGDHNLVGVLLNLSSPRIFKKNIGKFLSTTHACAINGDVGLIYLEGYNIDLKELPVKKLQIRADKILNQKSKFDFELLNSKKKNVVAQTWSKQGLIKGADVAHDAQLSFIVTDRELIIDGEISYNKKSKSPLTKEIVPSGIHISTDQVEGMIEDSLLTYLEKLNLPTTKISSLSLNYYGMELIVDPKLFAGLQFDAIINFEEEFSIEAAMDSLSNDEDSRKIGHGHISYHGLELYFQQLDEKSIVVGTSENPKITGHDTKLSTWVTGEPYYLTKVEGGGMMRSFLDIIPMFTSSKEFLGKMDNVSVRISTPKNGKSKVNSVIRFKEGQYALNSVLMMMIRSI